MSKIYKLETLYSKNANEKVIEWIIEIKLADSDIFEEYIISMFSGLFRKSKLNKPDTFLVKTGKNIGKSNETTVLDQAIKEARAKWTHKIQREGYISLKEKGFSLEQISKLTEVEIYTILPKHKSYVSGTGKPMKAVSLKNIKIEKIKYPLLKQHKLNGIRCTASSEVSLTSKDGLKYNIPQIIKELELLFSNINSSFVLDGELYKHGWILSKINSSVTKYSKDTPFLEFWIFDLSIEESKQFDRLMFLHSIQKTIIELDLQFIKVLDYEICENYDQMLKQTDESIALGYEGAIFRKPDALYQFGKRNLSMIKSKKFLDGEFKIIDIVPHAKNPNLGTFLLQNDLNNLKFKSEYTATTEQKAELLRNKHNYIGKLATVKYYERTVTNLPFHTQVLAIRDYE